MVYCPFYFFIKDVIVLILSLWWKNHLQFIQQVLVLWICFCITISITAILLSPSFLCFFSVHQNLFVFVFYCCLSWLPFPVDAFNEFIHLPCPILSSELLNITTLLFYPILFIFPGQ